MGGSRWHSGLYFVAELLESVLTNKHLRLGCVGVCRPQMTHIPGLHSLVAQADVRTPGALTHASWKEKSWSWLFVFSTFPRDCSGNVSSAGESAVCRVGPGNHGHESSSLSSFWGAHAKKVQDKRHLQHLVWVFFFFTLGKEWLTRDGRLGEIKRRPPKRSREEMVRGQNTAPEREPLASFTWYSGSPWEDLLCEDPGARNEGEGWGERARTSWSSKAECWGGRRVKRQPARTLVALQWLAGH